MTTHARFGPLQTRPRLLAEAASLGARAFLAVCCARHLAIITARRMHLSRPRALSLGYEALGYCCTHLCIPAQPCSGCMLSSTALGAVWDRRYSHPNGKVLFWQRDVRAFNRKTQRDCPFYSGNLLSGFQIVCNHRAYLSSCTGANFH